MNNVATTNDKANLREGPGSEYKQLGWIREGRSVKIVGGNGDWSQVKVMGGDMDGTVAWIHDDLLDFAD